MQVHKKELLYYRRADGRAPAEVWLEGLKDRKGRSVIRTRLDRLEAGNPGDHRGVGEGVKELRIDYGPGYRVYCGEDGEMIVVVLCGGDKSSQAADIRKAQEYWSDYRRNR